MVKCPKCGEDTAYLHSEDGLRQGLYTVEMRCMGKCQDEQNIGCDLMDHEPASVATVDIRVIIKQNTIEPYTDDTPTPHTP